MQKLLLACLGCIVLMSPARATPILTIAQNACPNTPALCTATNGVVAAGLFDPTLVSVTGGLLNDFEAAFNSWDNSLAKKKKWTLATADLSNTAKLNITTYQAFVQTDPSGENCGQTCGGAEIMITYTPGAASDPPGIRNPKKIKPGNAVWSQSVDTSDKLAGSLPGNPYLDNASSIKNRTLGPPASPFQYAGSFFYDAPDRDAPAIWIGDAFITTANYKTRTLTVYEEGVEWGFTVTSVPEPSAFLLASLGALCLAIYARARLDRKRVRRCLIK
jgi:hypothetical protein